MHPFRICWILPQESAKFWKNTDRFPQKSRTSKNRIEPILSQHKNTGQRSGVFFCGNQMVYAEFLFRNFSLDIEKGNCTSDDHRLILSGAVSPFQSISDFFLRFRSNHPVPASAFNSVWSVDRLRFLKLCYRNVLQDNVTYLIVRVLQNSQKWIDAFRPSSSVSAFLKQPAYWPRKRFKYLLLL